MSKKVSTQGYMQWLVNQVSGMTELIKKVAMVTAAEHPSDHEFTDSKEFPGTCKCGWITPGTACDCTCGGTLMQHVEKLPQQIGEAIQMAQLAELLGTSIFEIGVPRRSGRRTDN